MSDPSQTPALPAGFFAAPPPPQNSGSSGVTGGCHYDNGNSQQSHIGQPLSQSVVQPTFQQQHSAIALIQSNKRPREDSSFHCDACDMSLDSKSALQAHLASHTKCSQCSFTAAPKIVKAHYESAHGRFAGSGFKTVTVAVPGCPVQRFRICVGNNPEDVQQWIAERKRRFPKRNRMEAVAAAPSSPENQEAPTGVAALLAGYSSSDESGNETESKSPSTPQISLAAAPVAGAETPKEGFLLSQQEPNVVGVDAPKADTPKRGVCRFFARNGTCRNGDACAYSHDVVSGPPNQRQPSLPRDRSKETLLGKLLANDVKRERSITIQLLEYLVQSEFLENEA